MKKVNFFLLFILSSHAFASPDKPLHLTIKDKNICLYTNDAKTKTYNNQIYVYMGEIILGKKFKSTYSKVYKNIKTPIYRNNCIPISSSNFKNNIPYDIVFDMEKSYAVRVCVLHNSEKIQLNKVINGHQCSNTPLSSEKEKTFFEKILNIF